MTTEPLSVKVYSPAKVILQSFKAKEVNAPGFLGYLGVLPGHTALITELKAGDLRVQSSEGSDVRKFKIGGGYLEVSNNEVTILVDSVEELTVH